MMSISKYRLFRRLDSLTPLSSASSAYEAASPDPSSTASSSDTPSSVKTNSFTRTGSLRREKKSNPTTPRCAQASCNCVFQIIKNSVTMAYIINKLYYLRLSLKCNLTSKVNSSCISHAVCHYNCSWSNSSIISGQGIFSV